jgi:vancomycin resistance protein YoaR
VRYFAISLLLLTVPLFTAATMPNSTNIILDFGTAKIHIAEEDLTGGWFNYDANIKPLRQRAADMSPTDSFEHVFPDITKYINKIATRFESSPYDGSIHFTPHKVHRWTVTNQAIGRRINREKLYTDILTILRHNDYPSVKVEYTNFYPKPPQKIIAAIVKRSSSYTNFENNPPRENNIALALRAFNGLVIPAGYEVSFNKVVGLRTVSRGYQEAKIIMDGEYVEGIGGGVCQASTTVFNAVVEAGLQITESHNHSLQSHYVALGKDAMVSSVYDLRFVNNTGSPIYFETDTANNRATVTIYGATKGNNIHYKLSTVITKEVTPTEEIDEENTPPNILADFKIHPEWFTKQIIQTGENGYSVTTYIEAYKGNRLLSKKVLRKSTYKSRPTKFRPIAVPLPSTIIMI